MPDITQIIFIIMTIFTIGGAIGVVTSRRLFHSGLYLILSLFGVTGYYVLLSAGFLAVVQLMVYIGAVAILILFAIMFSQQVMAAGQTQLNRQWWISLIISALLLAVLVFTVNVVAWPLTATPPPDNTVEQLGLALLGSYLIPFEVIGVLLSAALIGAVILAREKTQEETET
ncbi:MAG: NADH-quinone oxidoreductase subunit J [Anaerolineae bacterium]|nr:NADH-quinone oxidoreductase subunit J [Anaerolineae bacterium]